MHLDGYGYAVGSLAQLVRCAGVVPAVCPLSGPQWTLRMGSPRERVLYPGAATMTMGMSRWRRKRSRRCQACR